MKLLNPLLHRKQFKKRYDVLNYFVRRQGYKVYLEIGIATGRCLKRVRCRDVTGVDPAPNVVQPNPKWNLQKKTSDDFFLENTRTFDLIFIDGLHIAEQVLKDIFNSLAALNPDGAILLHDCNPVTETRQHRASSIADGGKWNGDTWKAIAYVREYLPDLFTRVLDLDEGIGVIIPGPGAAVPKYNANVEKQAEEFFGTVNWNDLENNREQMLGLIGNRSDLERELKRAHLLL